MKRVLFLFQDEALPSTRIRVHNLLPELEAHGLRCEAERYPSGLLGRAGLLRRLRHFDIVVLQKKLLLPPEALALALTLRLASRKLVFDFDDAIYIRDDKHREPRSLSRWLKFRAVASAAHMVLAGSGPLREAALRYCRDVRVLPSAVRTTGVPLKEHAGVIGGGPTVLGWVGARGNLHHLGMLDSVLKGLAERHEIVLHVVSDARAEVPGVRVVNIPWSLEGQDREVARFDVGLMPLPDNPWTRGKCGYKALQYMAAGVPPVCSDVGGNRSLVEHGVEGFVASGEQDFGAALGRLIEDPLLRQRMGQSARQRAVREYSIEAVGGRLAAILSE